jgi:branched-chain amino acid transport system permease protein
MMNLRLAKYGRLRQIWVSYLGLGVCSLVILTGAAVLIEMVYHLQLGSAVGPQLLFLGIPFNAGDMNSWFGSVFVMLTGLGLFELLRRQYLREWSDIQERIEEDTKGQDLL